MKKLFFLSLISAMLLSISACGDMSVKEIESHSYPGYCKNESGQDLTVDQCNQKMARDVSAKPRKSESESMMQHVNEDIKTQK